MQFCFANCAYCFAIRNKIKNRPNKKQYICDHCNKRLIRNYKSRLRKTQKFKEYDISKRINKFYNNINNDVYRSWDPNPKYTRNNYIKKCYLCKQKRSCHPIFLCRGKHQYKYSRYESDNESSGIESMDIHKRKISTTDENDQLDNQNQDINEIEVAYIGEINDRKFSSLDNFKNESEIIDPDIQDLKVIYIGPIHKSDTTEHTYILKNNERSCIYTMCLYIPKINCLLSTLLLCCG